MKRLLSLVPLFLFAIGLKGQPGWVKEGRQVKVGEISGEDYAYLRDWIGRNARPAEEYLLGQFKSHDVVIFGEYHNVREHKEFLIRMLPRLYDEAGVRCIGWEFSNPNEDAELARLVSMPAADSDAVLNFGRRHLGSWNSKEHWDLIEAVRKLNVGLPAGQPKMRFVGIDIPVNWHDLYTKIKKAPKASPEAKEVQRWFVTRDRVMAENAARATLEQGVKGLLFVGRGHDETHLSIDRPVMGKALRDKYGDRVFQVAGDGGRYPAVELALEGGAGQGAVAFDLYASPFAGILSDDITPPRPMAELVRGYIYFGSCRQLHSNTPIKGFVTEEMYREHSAYYEADFGVKFGSAREMDEYLQKTNWKIGCP